MNNRVQQLRHWFILVALLAGIGACAGEAPAVFLSGPILEGSGNNGEVALDGAVMNAKGETAEYVQVTFILYGVDGKVLETITQLVEGNEDLGTLENDEIGTFFVVSDTPADQIARIEYILSYDDVSIGPEPLR